MLSGDQRFMLHAAVNVLALLNQSALTCLVLQSVNSVFMCTACCVMKNVECGLMMEVFLNIKKTPVLRPALKI